jgi:ABC-type uncharacterized transport system substrate-binding protein
MAVRAAGAFGPTAVRTGPVEIGGLMAYAFDQTDVGHQVADEVDQIHRARNRPTSPSSSRQNS